MKNIEPKKLCLANLPTPIQKVVFEGKSFLIKRDDFTGLETSGNKIRKLEYLLYKAKKEKADYVFTTGGEQSNHARTTAVSSASIGLKSKLFLWGKDSANADGNLFLDKIFGAELRFLSKAEFINSSKIMSDEEINFKKKNKKIFLIPEGGSSTLGIWGYINFIHELNSQLELKKLNGITAASGSGGTAAGMLIGLTLLGLKTKIFAVNVLYEKKIITEKIFTLVYDCIKEFNLKIKIDESLLEIVDGYSTEGYKNISADKLSVIKSFARSSGILLDPTYTGKAFNAYNDNFIGNKNLFVHTGGIFGAFNKRKNYLET
ncbi:MAG: D-cysteine desulfhydrase [Chlorobiaceae bacterium]|nr:D-cysteine desulfhydrase [Chlorobiaceae bacterium]MBA4309979.1 D-cysteine desulfhydrase [Chlorobiaceae bacterium]